MYERLAKPYGFQYLAALVVPLGRLSLRLARYRWRARFAVQYAPLYMLRTCRCGAADDKCSGHVAHVAVLARNPYINNSSSFPRLGCRLCGGQRAPLTGGDIWFPNGGFFGALNGRDLNSTLRRRCYSETQAGWKPMVFSTGFRIQ